MQEAAGRAGDKVDFCACRFPKLSIDRHSWIPLAYVGSDFCDQNHTPHSQIVNHNA